MRARTWMIIVLAAPAAALAGVLLVNAWDAPLRPEITKIVDHPPQPTPAQKNAYFYILGVQAGEEQDPQKKGEELWNSRRGDPAFWRELRRRENPWRTEFAGCGDQVCSVKYLDTHPETAEALKDPAKDNVLKHYIRLIEYGAGTTLVPADWPTAPLSGLPGQTHRLFLLQLAQWLRQGGDARVMDLLVLSNEFLRSFALSGASALERAVAIVNMKQNAKFVRAELARRPKWRVTRELAESFHVPSSSDIMFGVQEGEVRAFYTLVRGLRSFADIQESTLADEGEVVRPARLLNRLPVRLLLRPNESLNKHWNLLAQIISSDCPAGTEIYACVPQARWVSPSGLEHVVNPVGRFLVRMMLANMHSMQRKLRENIYTINEVKGELRSKLAGEM